MCAVFCCGQQLCETTDDCVEVLTESDEDDVESDDDDDEILVSSSDSEADSDDADDDNKDEDDGKGQAVEVKPEVATAGCDDVITVGDVTPASSCSNSDVVDIDKLASIVINDDDDNYDHGDEKWHISTHKQALNRFNLAQLLISHRILFLFCLLCRLVIKIIYDFFQCLDTVGWMTGRASSLYEITISSPQRFFLWRPRVGSGVVRIDALRFLAGCRTRRLNQA